MVIPALDEAERIAGAVASAREGATEVIVVDGGSRDATVARAEAAGARVVRAPAGRARQLEAGRRVAESEVVVFLHADTRLPAGWPETVRRALADPRYVGGAFRIRFAEGGWRLRLVAWGANLRSRWAGLPYGDQALFARRTILEALGGLPQAPIMEDLDLVRALKRRGRLRLLPSNVETSARRYGPRPLRQMLRNWLALGAWRAGVDRDRVAAWYRR